MTERSADLNEVQQRLEEIQNRKRAGVRWHVSKHTAELAIGALETGLPNAKPASRPGKARRRKKAKRLL
ncbi:MAG: hypothetical protein ABI205_06035 [Gemmatimonadaceae bacterium]